MKIPFHVDLSGKTAVVTGGSGVLCSQMARALAACGAQVALINRSLENGRRVAEEIGSQAEAFAADVTDLASLKKAQADITERFGPVSILINGAGGNRPEATTEDEQYDPARDALRDFFQLDPEGIRAVMDLNYMGSLLPTQVFAREMTGRPGACVVNISSMAAYQPMTRVMAYAGAKAAINSLTKALAMEYMHRPLRINAVAPGGMMTNIAANMRPPEGFDPELVKRYTPLRGLVEVDDVADMVAFLASDAASGYHGAIISIDKGITAG